MPVRDEIVEEMSEYHLSQFGNPQSIHSMGANPKKALNRARNEVASLINTKPGEIFFTSGATESINLALKGVMSSLEGRGKLAVSAVDHQSVFGVARSLEKLGHELVVLPVDSYGKIDLSESEKIIPGADIVSIPSASFEVGTLQDVGTLVGIARDNDALVHLDLVPSAFQMPFDSKEIPVDLVSLSSNSLLGPKGVGALYKKEGVNIGNLIDGGGHENGLRSGSSNIPGIVGMGAAARIAKERMEEESKRMSRLRDHLIQELLRIDYSYLNGHPADRLPNNANIGFDYIEGESMLMMLDMQGISASSGSACTSHNLQPSPTLTAMGLPPEKAHGSLQFVLHPYISEEDIIHVTEVMPDIVSSLREMSPLWKGGGVNSG